MASVKSLDVGKDAWHTYVSKKTEALPKNTLFGTALEKTDPKSLAIIDSDAYERAEASRRKEKAEQYEHKLPERMRNSGAVEILRNDRKELTEQEQRLGDRQQAIAAMESRARYFQTLPPSLNKNDQVYKKMLLADPSLDFELTKRMNTIGYGEKNDYNRERNRVRPPVHRYAVIGDPLEYGMDFSLHHTETQEKYNAPKPVDQPPILHHHLRKERVSSTTTVGPTHDHHGVPANIRAFYGSRIVDELFSDQDAIDQIKDKISIEKRQRQKPHQKITLPTVEVSTPRNYGDLSHNLRQDKFSGYTFHRPTMMKETHTREVFDRRFKDPDEFRHQWDEYGKWKDQELLRNKMDKELQEHIDSQVKLEPNWDRNARAPKQQKLELPKPTRKPKPAAKKKAKPPKPAAESKKPVFEDVVFLTPPITPDLPPPPPAETLPTTNKRDDEFWKFYDQGLPPVR